jgi:hypothetical protein
LNSKSDLGALEHPRNLGAAEAFLLTRYKTGKYFIQQQ